MNRHSLHYIDLHPDPIEDDEPDLSVLIVGAALTLLALWFCIVFLFSL